MGSIADLRHVSPILVTGASGFVGANLCRYFAERDADVVAVAGRTRWRLEGAPVRCHPIDLIDRQQVRAAIREIRPRVIVNCAAYGAYSTQTEADRIYRVNFEAVRDLLDAASELGDLHAFVHAGSSSEYGLRCAAPSEDDAPEPDSHYAVSKVAATSLVHLYGAKLGIPAWCLRLYSVYGPMEDGGRLIPNLLAHAAEKKLPKLVEPRVSRDFVHVDDVGAAFVATILKAGALPKGRAYNVGTGTKTTLAALVDCARDLFGIVEQPSWGSMPNRNWDHPDWYANPERAKRELGWTAQTSLSEGLLRTSRWLADHPDLAALARDRSVVRA